MGINKLVTHTHTHTSRSEEVVEQIWATNNLHILFECLECFNVFIKVPRCHVEIIISYCLPENYKTISNYYNFQTCIHYYNSHSPAKRYCEIASWPVRRQSTSLVGHQDAQLVRIGDSIRCCKVLFIIIYLKKRLTTYTYGDVELLSVVIISNGNYL
jgi:hypothetical protein